MSTFDHIKYHVDQIKQEKHNIEPRADMPGIELLYEQYGKENTIVHAVLSYWELYTDVSTEQALVHLVDTLIKQNGALSEEVLKLHQTSTRPVIIHGNATGARIITGNNNKGQ